MTAAQFRALQERRRTGGRPAAAVPPPRKKAPKKPPGHPGPPSVPEPPDVQALLTGLSGVGRVETLLMPYVEKMLTSNQRMHWRPESAIRKQLRADAAGIAVTRRLPRLERAAVFYVLHPRPLSRKRDPGNWSPSVKAYVDGLVTDGRVLPDDSHEFLLGPYPVMGSPVSTGFARMTLVIAELCPAGS
ncbi:hypothetical protein [Streptomyces rubiginosohelvolus]|uniref:hypothetical protein n=1 Tax=Streptomyces rubiginosohelvolus TaxID=67362 RepID=UPI0035D66220